MFNPKLWLTKQIATSVLLAAMPAPIRRWQNRKQDELMAMMLTDFNQAMDTNIRFPHLDLR